MLELIMFLMVIAIEIDTLVSGTKCTSNVNLSPCRALIDAQVLRQIISVCVSVRCVNCGHSCLRPGSGVEKISQESESGGIHQITHIIINLSVYDQQIDKG